MKIPNINNWFLTFLVFILIAFSVSEVKAQTFPLTGATWVFKDSTTIWTNDYAEKWEYINDSITVDGVFKKMKVTTKIVNPGWIPFDTTTVVEDYQYFLYVGDTVWKTNDSLSPLANFSLQVGDSAYTPYHSTFSPLYPLIMDSSNNCSQEVQSLFFQKGVVVDAGIETENNINYRVYELKYLDELGNVIIRKFSERTILTEGYWHSNNVFLSSCSTTDFLGFSFLCYKDDFSTVPICSDVEWFENLNIEDEQILKLEIFPNPSSDFIKIKTNDFGSFTLNVYDVIGKSRIYKEVYFTGDNEISLDISKLEPGIYHIGLTSDNQRITTRFIKN